MIRAGSKPTAEAGTNGPTLGEHMVYAFDDDHNGLDEKEFDQAFDWSVAGILSLWIFFIFPFARGQGDFFSLIVMVMGDEGERKCRHIRPPYIITSCSSRI